MESVDKNEYLLIGVQAMEQRKYDFAMDSLEKAAERLRILLLKINFALMTENWPT